MTLFHHTRCKFLYYLLALSWELPSNVTGYVLVSDQLLSKNFHTLLILVDFLVKDLSLH